MGAPPDLRRYGKRARRAYAMENRLHRKTFKSDARTTTVHCTAERRELSCVCTDLAGMGEMNCQPLFTRIFYRDTFDQERIGIIDNNEGTGWNFGECTSSEGVGIYPRWSRLATLQYECTHRMCTNHLCLEASELGATLGDGGEANVIEHSCVKHRVQCLGWIFNLAPEVERIPEDTILPSDYAIIAPCWITGGRSCAFSNVDFDCDGVVGPGDLSFFATAWMKEICEPHIIVPACQLHCDTDLP